MPKIQFRKSPLLSLFLLPASFLAPVLSAQQTPLFTPGNLVVAVEGCGVNAGTCTNVPNGNGTGAGNSSSGGYGDNQAAPLTLFQYSLNGTSSASYVNALVLPQTGSGANLPIAGEYGSSSEGTLQLSGTGQYLTIGTYGINAAVFDAAPTTYGAAPSNALAQSGSLTGQSYTPVARVLTLIDPFGNVNSSTALYNIFNTNNPRSMYTLNGTTAYVSGQGNASDATGGVFYTVLGKPNSAPTPITGLDTSSNSLSQDTRDVQIYNNTLYVSADSKEGSNNARSFVGTLGTPPATSVFNNSAGPTQLATSNNAASPTNVTSSGKLVLTASEVNGLNATGQTINLSPSGYYFANAYTMYIADGGNPKQNSASTLIGDGGLQKWINTKTDGSGTWKLQYTLASGLNLVLNPNASSPANTTGTTGLYALTGTVVGNTVYLYTTNQTIADLDPTYLYGITDSLTATANPGETFTQLAAAPSDSNFKGVAFAPTLPAGSATITTTPSGLSVTTAGTGCAPGTYSTPVTLIWTQGSTCQLSTVTPQTFSNTSYVFTQWQDGTTSTTDTVTAPTTSAAYSATFTNNYKPVGNLDEAVDSATSSTTVSTSDSVFVSGWAADPVDGSPLTNVTVYIDGTSAGTPTLGIARQDVATAYNNPAYKSSGYQLAYPTTSLAVGSHAVTVIAIDSTSRSTTFGPLNFSVVAPTLAPVGNLDQAVDATTASTTVAQKDNLYASGWAGDPQDGDPLKTLNVYVDGILAGAASQGVSRPDVVTATGNNAYANSGFYYTGSAASYTAGTHTATAIALDNEGLSTTFGPVSFTVTSTAPVGHLEQAVDNATGSSSVSQSDSLFVSGWAADYHDNSGAKQVQIYVDGVSVGLATLGQARPDVATAYNIPGWGTSGYTFAIAAGAYSIGSHAATAVATDATGLTTNLGPVPFTVTQ